MIIETLRTLYSRDLERLKTEISSYQNEKALWEIDKEIANSGGNLCLHLVGNLETYIGTQLGGTGYVRDRAFEFAGKDIPKMKLLSDIDGTIAVVNQALANLTRDGLQNKYPTDVFGSESTTEYVLLSLLAHLNYHLGQINYHRRLLDRVGS